MAVKVMELKRIAYDCSLVPSEGSEVCCELAAPAKHSNKDPAGHAFHAFALRQAGHVDEVVEGDVTESGPDRPSTPSADEFYSARWQHKGKKKKQTGKEDLYALLGLANERWTANDNQIKLAYRKQALEHHPDKAGAAVADEGTKKQIEEHFQKIQDAYETLSDPAKRREYDSTDDFDDTLPSTAHPAEFFKVFGPAFKRNSRWSLTQPVPDVGDEETPYNVVDKFYDFWFSFKSWREFPHDDEEDIEQAESREEKRWIERFNNKLRQPAKKEEARRMKQFVNDAFAQDPRILQRRAEEKAQREKRKSDKAAARNRKAEDEKREKEEAAAAAAAQEAVAAEAAAEARKTRQVEKKAMQKQRSKLRTLSASLISSKSFEDDDVELICSKSGLGPLQALTDALAATDSPQEHQSLLQASVEELQGAEETDRRAKEKAVKQAAAEAAAEKRKATLARVERMKDWDDEEVRMLEKALDKFPQGTAKRWEVVTQYVRTRTQEEVLDMVKHGLKSRKGMQTKQEQFSIAKKRQANTTIKSDPTGRMESFTDVDINISGPAVHSMTNGEAHPAERHPPTANGTATDPSKQKAPQQPGPQPDEPKPQKQAPTLHSPPSANSPDSKAANSSLQAHANGGPPQSAPAAADVPATAEWTEESQKLLVNALKEIGKQVPDRWQRVAEVVPGKTRAQCQKLFRELKNDFRAKKDATSSEL
ncbi:hypothetical protein ABBQ32_006697 [Trebouxia sp. C0010 RCD-2024]